MKQAVRFSKHDKTLKRSPQNRRLDSIARLLNTKDEVCTAICFNNGRILLANNTAKLTNLQKEYISFFRACLVHGPEYLKTAQCHAQYQKLLTTSISETDRPGKHLEKAINAVEDLHVKKQPLTPERKAILEEIAADFTKFFRPDCAKIVSDYLVDQKTDLSEIYNFYQDKLLYDRRLAQNRLSIDIDKVVHALTSKDDKAFADDIKTAFLQPFLFIDTPKLHAEMKILDYLYVMGQLDLDTPQIDISVEPIYLGISKLCCLECSATVKALNDHVKELFEAEQIEVHDFPSAEAAATTTPRQHQSATAVPVTPPKQMIGAAKPQESPIQTRGFHLGSFPGWQAPEFLKLIDNKYQQTLAELSEDIKTKHLPGFSPSPVTKILSRSIDSNDPKQHLPPPPALLRWDDEEITAAAASSAPEQIADIPRSNTRPKSAQRIEIWNRKAYISKPQAMVFSTPAAKSGQARTPSTVAHKFQGSPQTLTRSSAEQDSLQGKTPDGKHAPQKLSFAESPKRPQAKPAAQRKTQGGKHVSQGTQSREASFTERELAKLPPAATARKIPGSELAPTKSRKYGKTQGMQSREASFAEQELAKLAPAATDRKVPGSELAITKSKKHSKNQGMQSREASFAERELAKKPSPKEKRWFNVVSKKNTKGPQK